MATYTESTGYNYKVITSGAIVAPASSVLYTAPSDGFAWISYMTLAGGGTYNFKVTKASQVGLTTIYGPVTTGMEYVDYFGKDMPPDTALGTNAVSPVFRLLAAGESVTIECTLGAVNPQLTVLEFQAQT